MDYANGELQNVIWKVSVTIGILLEYCISKQRLIYYSNLKICIILFLFYVSNSLKAFGAMEFFHDESCCIFFEFPAASKALAPGALLLMCFLGFEQRPWFWHHGLLFLC